jgi:hypothetical protein
MITKRLVAVLLFLGIIWLAIMWPTLFPSRQETLTPIADADVILEEPDKNTGHYIDLLVSGYLDPETGEVSNGSFAFLMFDLSEIPSGATIYSTELKLYARDVFALDTSLRVGVYYCAQEWDEHTITWNNQPPSEEEAIIVVDISAPGWYSWDVTHDAQQALPIGKLTEVLALTEGSYQGSVYFDSKEGINIPKLEVTVSAPVSWEALEVFLICTGIIGGVAGWFVRHEMARVKRSRVKALLEEIDDFYARWGWNAERCKAGLIALKDRILDEFKSGKISEENYAILERKIDDYIKVLRRVPRRRRVPKCVECGGKLAPGDRFCPYCGTPVAT